MLHARSTLVPPLLLAVLFGACASSPLVDANGALDPVALRALEDDVAHARGLPLQREVPARLVTQEELRGELRGYFARNEDHAKKVDAALHAFGVLQPSQRYRDVVEALLGSAAAGVYLHPAAAGNRTGTLLVVSDYDLAARLSFALTGLFVGDDLSLRPALGHELVHALQDQHFRMDRLHSAQAADDDADRDLARSWLLEADANVYTTCAFLALSCHERVDRGVGLWFMRANLAALEPLLLASFGLRGIPALVAKDAMEPYSLGTPVVARLLDEGGLQALDAALRLRAPESTEQMLFPDAKYFTTAPDRPQRLPPLSRDDVGGRTIVVSNVWGAWRTMVLLEQPLLLALPGEASRIADGWGGDRFEVVDGGTSVWRSAWDTPHDAEELWAAVPDWLFWDGVDFDPIDDDEAQRARSGHDDDRSFVEADGRFGRAVRKGAHVVVVRRADSRAEADRLVDVALARFTPLPQPAMAWPVGGDARMPAPSDDVARRSTVAGRLIAPHRTIVVRTGMRLTVDGVDASAPRDVQVGLPLLADGDGELRWGIHHGLELSIADGIGGAACVACVFPSPSSARPLGAEVIVDARWHFNRALTVGGTGALLVGDHFALAGQAQLYADFGLGVADVRLAGGALWQPLDRLTLSLGVARVVERDSEPGAALVSHSALSPDGERVLLGAALLRGGVPQPTLELQLSGMVHVYEASTLTVAPSPTLRFAHEHTFGLLLVF